MALATRPGLTVLLVANHAGLIYGLIPWYGTFEDREPEGPDDDRQRLIIGSREMPL